MDGTGHPNTHSTHAHTKNHLEDPHSQIEQMHTYTV